MILNKRDAPAGEGWGALRQNDRSYAAPKVVFFVVLKLYIKG